MWQKLQFQISEINGEGDVKTIEAYRVRTSRSSAAGHLKLQNFSNIKLFASLFLWTFIFFLSLIHRQNLKDQILTTNIWLEHEWQDHKFKWDPAEYGGVTELYVPSEHIWLPDIVLYNK